MTLLEIFLVGIGLSMDAFAVSICKGLAMPAVNKKQALLIGAYFGVFQDEEVEPVELRHKELFLLAVATSIDALAVGVSFSMVELSVPIGAAAALIGCTTFAISVGGVFVGHIFGARYKNRAEFVGGAILILIGVKILLEHFGVL